jgi:hypothetical protein
MRQILSLILLLSFFVACGNKSKTIKYGEITSADLVALKGEPIKEEPLSSPNSKMFIYENNEKYQINDGVVVNSFRTPVGDERMLIHWKHKYSDCTFQITKLDQKVLHQKVEEEHKCVSAGVSVIYDPNIEQVVRVVEYAAE